MAARILGPASAAAGAAGVDDEPTARVAVREVDQERRQRRGGDRAAVAALIVGPAGHRPLVSRGR